MSIAIEYQMFIKKFTKSVETELGDLVDSLVLVGSIASKTQIDGESDVDFYLILDDSKFESVGGTLSAWNKVSKLVGTYLENPLFVTMLDLTILVKAQIPKTGDCETGLSPIRVLNGVLGETKLGTNPFEGLEIPDEIIQRGAKQMAGEYLDQLKDLCLMINDIPPYEILYNAVDTVLGCAQAALYFQGTRDLSRCTAPELLPKAFGDKFNNEVVLKAHHFRLAAEDISDSGDLKFIADAADFCHSILRYVNE
ncbi:MAG: hypothetical protein ACTSYA_00850 [Candidatus Kariarchaeaceae archaeon]